MYLIAAALGVTCVGSAGRLLWIRHHVRKVRDALARDHRLLPDGEETLLVLRLEALFHASIFGRVVRLTNLDSCGF